MKQVMILVLVVIQCTVVFSQQDIVLVRGKKTVELDWKHKMLIYYRSTVTNDDSIVNWVDGKAMKVKFDSVAIDPIISNREVFQRKNKKWTEILQKSYGSERKTNIVLHVNDIEKIQVQSKTLSPLFGVVSLLSFASALVVSPLVSLDYKNGTFDARKYGTITGLSLASTTVFLTVCLSTQKRKFAIGKKKGSWSIQ